MHRVLGDDRERDAGYRPSEVNDASMIPGESPNYDMGGNDFGVNDAGSWGGDMGGGGGGSDDWS